jgi:hypothetical protein
MPVSSSPVQSRYRRQVDIIEHCVRTLQELHNHQLLMEHEYKLIETLLGEIAQRLTQSKSPTTRGV